MRNKKIAILGAGPSGLAQLRAFEAARQEGVENLPEVVCYEKQSDIGGLWNYTWRAGSDKNGEPVHGSMYRYLWSNGPKECLEFSDYSFDEHFGQAIPSYPPRAVLRDYIMGRIDQEDIAKYIRFECPVRWVTYDDNSELFAVTVMNHKTGQQETEQFDYVVVATGHFSTPNMPHFKGLEQFSGRVLHAHDFRDALEFENQDILLVGGSYSAEDIGSQCYKYGAKSVTISYRTSPIGFDWPEGMDEVPLLTHFDGNTAHFTDGSSKHFDSVVMCTGYLFHFPFLPDALRLQTHNCLYPDHLYKGIFFQENPKMMYLGMQDQYYTFNMFDVQAWYARDFMLGKLQLPDAQERLENMQHWLGRHADLGSSVDNIDFQGSYIRDLHKETNYPEFAIEEQGEMFKQWLQDKKADIMAFREGSYSSTVTGTLATQLPAPWLEIKDDSLESFMALDFISLEEQD